MYEGTKCYLASTWCICTVTIGIKRKPNVIITFVRFLVPYNVTPTAKMLECDCWISIFPRLDYGVYVLFHELYPTKEISSTLPIDRDEILTSQGFITALQKMDLENALDETNLLYQINHIPISFFNYYYENDSICKPGTSNASPYDTLLVSKDVTPPFGPSSPLFSLPTFSSPSHSDTLPEPCRRDVDTVVPSLVVEHEAANDSTACSLSSLPNVSPLPFLSDTGLTDSDLAAVPAASGNREHFKDLPKQNNSLLSFNMMPVQRHSCENLRSRTSFSEQVCHDKIARTYSNPFDILGENGSVDSFSVSATNQAIFERDFEPLTNASNVSIQSSNPHNSQINHKYHSRRKMNSLTSKINENGGSNTEYEPFHSSISSDRENCNFFQGFCSSDSELDYKPDRTHLPKNRQDKRLCSDADLRIKQGKNVKYSTWFENIITIRNKTKLNSRSSLTSLKFADICESNTLNQSDVSYDRNSTSASVTGSSRRCDRHIRDLDMFEMAGVPFSYEDVVYSTNDEFRKMKSTPGLTEEQQTAMLDARRRATNRQAAERCRRLKLAARDELAERLSQLRIQRQVLTKRLIRARQRRYEARDHLTTEQNRLLSMLQGPDGCRLEPANWRVRLTKEDEIVVVSVGH